MDNDRRKLLLGSAAAPLILTVRPAAAHARTSIAMCMDKDAKKAKPHEILASHGHADHWMRKSVDIYRLSVWDEHKRKWNTLDNRRFMCGVDGQTYWELDRNAPYSAPARPTSMRRGHGVQEVRIDQRMALAYLEYDGNFAKVVGYGWEPKGGKHYTKSCWHSIKPKGW